MSSHDIYSDPPERRGTGCLKIDGLRERYGNPDLISLWVADMDFPVPEAVTDALRRRIDHPVYGYSMVPQSYWDSISRWIESRYHFTPSAGSMSFIPGVVRGIGLIMNYFCKNGDGVVILSPVYHPFKILAGANSLDCIEVALDSDASGRFYINFSRLEECFASRRPRLMVLCNPHNPGGRQWSLDELRRMASLAAKYGVMVISDEIHGDLMLFGHRHNSFFEAGEEAREWGMVLGAPSKTFNIPGLNSSWMVVENPAMRDGFYSWLSLNEFNDPPFFATIATEAAYNHGDGWLRETLEYIEQNITFLISQLETRLPAIKAVCPEASYLVWLDCRSLGMDSEALARFFTDEAGLALNNGAMFGKEGEGFMRINVALPRKRLAEAIDRLVAAVKNHNT